MQADEVAIHHSYQERAENPFTISLAREFFKQFRGECFIFDGKIGHIFIVDGKYIPPEAPRRDSYVAGFLFKETIDETDAMSVLPNPIGSIEFVIGGINTSSLGLRITVRKYK